MKKSILLISFFLVGMTTIVKSQSESYQSEEYAIVDVVDRGKTKSIRITYGAKRVEDVEWEKEKTDNKDDFRPVLKVLEDMNKKGYRLLNMSTAYSTNGGGGSRFTGVQPIRGELHYTFMMVKKINTE